MLDPWLKWALMCDLSDAAFLSQGPLPHCGSEKSRRFTETSWQVLAKLAPTIGGFHMTSLKLVQTTKQLILLRFYFHDI